MSTKPQGLVAADRNNISPPKLISACLPRMSMTKPPTKINFFVIFELEINFGGGVSMTRPPTEMKPMCFLTVISMY